MYLSPISSSSHEISTHSTSAESAETVDIYETINIYEELSSYLSSRRRFRAETNDPRARPYYFKLEKEADAKLAESRQSGWAERWRNTFKRECYFRSIAGKYEKASSLAAKLSQFEDAARLKEKEGLVFGEKWEWGFWSLSAGCYLLLDAWKGYAQIGNQNKTVSVGEKAIELADRNIALQYQIKSRSDLNYFLWDCNFRIARSLLTKAEIINVIDPLHAGDYFREVEQFCEANDVSYSYVQECQHRTPSEESTESYPIAPHLAIEAADLLAITGLKEQAALAYEEAGKRCMEYYKEDIAVGHLHPALIAGLCFEKSPRCQEQAMLAYARVLEPIDRIDLLKEEMGDFAIIYAGPIYLEATLASLKLGREDLFAKFIQMQASELISFADSYPTLGESEIFIDYAKALINVAEIILGADSKDWIKLKEEISFPVSAQTRLPKTHFEAALLAVYAAPRITAVKDMMELLEDRRLLSP